MERLLLHPRNCLIFHSSGRLFYNLAHSCSHPCSPRPSLPSRPVFHAASSSSSLALVSCRPVHSILSRSFSLSHVYVYTLSLLLAQPPRSLFTLPSSSLPFSVSLSPRRYPSASVLLPRSLHARSDPSPRPYQFSLFPPRAATRPRVTWLCGCTCTKSHTVAHDRPPRQRSADAEYLQS